MNALDARRVLELIPQQRPFRFVDEIAELDEEHILGFYKWKDEDCLGQPAGHQIVPNFKLLEMAAQIGVVAWCIYHLSLRIGPEELAGLVGVFTQVEHAEFVRPVRPGETVGVLAQFGESGYFRDTKLVAEVQVCVSGGPHDGEDVFSGVLSGMFVPRASQGS